MKKFIIAAAAAGALAAGGAASAQDVSTIINSIIGLAMPEFSQSQQQIYQDQFGRQFYYDQYGRQVYVQTQPYSTIIGYDQWGRPLYSTNSYPYSGQYAYGGSTWDYDGDGVSNSRDRWPNDPRYW